MEVITTNSFLLFLLLTFFIYSIPSASSSSPTQLKETKLTLYFHDILTGPNATFVRVVGVPGKPWSFGDFGTIYINDDFVTESLSPNSPIIARGQGIYTISSLDGSNAYTALSVVFTKKAYAGSTLQFQGSFSQTGNVSEVSVVSGTGKFRFTRGYAIFETITFNSTDLVAKCDITVRLD